MATTFWTPARLWGVVLLLLAGSMVALCLYWLGQNAQKTSSFYQPKFMNVRVDGVLTWRDGPSVDVMAGEIPVKITCEKVATPTERGTASFRVTVGTEVREIPNCEHVLSLSAKAGEVVPVRLDYEVTTPAGERTVVDHWALALHVIAGGENVRIHAFETAAGAPLPLLTVPGSAIPYVDMAVALESLKPEDLAVVFFVERSGSGRPVLQVLADEKNPAHFEANAAPLKRYRDYGPRLAACAAWPAEPIQIGGPDDWRVLLEVFAMVVRTRDLPAVLAKTMSFQGLQDDKARLKALPVTREALRGLAYHGLVSEGVPVVRTAEGSVPTESGFWLPE